MNWRRDYFGVYLEKIHLDLALGSWFLFRIRATLNYRFTWLIVTNG